MSDEIFEINKEALAKELGLESISDEDKVELYNLFEENMVAKLGLYLDSVLNEEEQAETTGMSYEQLFEYLSGKELDLNALAVKCAVEVKEELLSDVAFMKGYMAAKQEEDGQDAA